MLNPAGVPAQILLLSLEGKALQMCMSAEVYAEYDEVLRRPRFGWNSREIEDALRSVRERGLWVKPIAVVRACTDPEDDLFLECALAAQAEYVVTGNLRHFPERWGDTRVVTARHLVDSVLEE